MKSKKFIIIFVCILILGAIFFDTHYVVINKEIYKNDIKKISVYSLNDSDIKNINKCTEIEKMVLADVSENSFTKFKNFPNLNYLMIMSSELSSVDSEKISTFDNLKNWIIDSSTVDFKGFNNDSVSCIIVGWSKIKNLNALSECQSLKSITIGSVLYDNYIVFENKEYVMKDSSFLTSFDCVEELRIFEDKIEDISGILEMDSLKVLEIDKGTISEDDRKLLEDKGISIIEHD